jgi:hypothetical protein
VDRPYLAACFFEREAFGLVRRPEPIDEAKGLGGQSGDCECARMSSEKIPLISS